MSHEQETEGMKPYPEYKRSGAEGLPNVPQPWEIGALKRVANFKSGAGFPVSEQGLTGSELPFFKVSDMNLPGNEGTLRTWNNSISRGTADELGAYIFPAGSIVFPKVGGALLTNKRRLTERPSCIDNNLMGCTVKQANQDFMFRVLGHIDLGNIAKPGPVPAISEREVQEIRAAFPPLEEQAAIVRFLDHAGEQIQRYIASKERLIALLEEERQALIHQAVTRGLDPNVRLKPSGVEWLGDVPEHWRIGPLKRAFVSMDYGISESASDSGTIHLLTMGNLRDGQVIVPHEGGVDSVDEYLLLREGDLLFNRTNSRELVGKVGLFAGHDSPTTFASYLVRMRPLPDQEPEYLNMALNDASLISHARRESVPSLHQSNLNPTRYGRIHIALPPKDEQDAILRTLQKETATLRDSVIQTRRQINLMNEYRTRLIADVVTGQLDVRKAAAQLPVAP